MERLRLVLAGLFVWVVMMAIVAAVGSAGFFDSYPFLIAAVMAPIFLGLIVAALLIFNRKGAPVLGGKTQEQYIRELEEAGLIESSDYRARRAFQVEEYEDEGSHYYLELDDRRVLFLTGQYLYEYEAIDDDPELKQARRFPCTDFTVRLHKTEKHVVDLVCRGEPLEPELVAGSFRDVWTSDELPHDGLLIDASYDDVKAEVLRKNGPGAR
jgi:hypothetical protein